MTTIVGCASAEPSAPAPAQESNVAAAKEPTRFVCREYDRATQQLLQRTVVFAQAGADGLVDGKKAAFTLDVYEGTEAVAATEVEGTAETDDVQVSFKSKDGKVGFTMFLDELNESTLRLDGGAGGEFACAEGHLVCSAYDRATQKLKTQTVVLTKKSPGKVLEGKPAAFELALFEGLSPLEERSAEGTVELDDVQLTFSAADGKVGFTTFLDELSESTLTLDKKEAGDFSCR
jgi:hypothetical protein